jgi:GT2 family glycosyltransferase
VTDERPLVSVIVVCWNSADVLGRCLEHLLAQDYENYEIVVVDDGSSDDTMEVAEEALGSGRLTVVHSTLNRGCPHARNLGLRHARGDLIAFIDGDGFAAPTWLSEIVHAFRSNPSAGAVASTVFIDANPFVLNGAGGMVNRQGWAADLCMNVPYEHAEIPSEALYAMGCGMSLRRSAVDAVGDFDDRMLNYYDDVDYGIRVWRAGYRVVVAADAWIDHGFGHSSGDSSRKQLLCEQHRMRVVLTHTPARFLGRWLVNEWRATRQAFWPRRALKLMAVTWNLRHLPDTLRRRWHLRGSPAPPDHLVDPSWGEGFPPAMPPLLRPDPAMAKDAVDASDADAVEQLSYGWYPTEEIGGRAHTWSAPQAAALVSLDSPARRLRLEYAQAPLDTGGVDVSIRRTGGRDPFVPMWRRHLAWQFIERCVQNHPVDLPPGDYEVAFSTPRAFTAPPFETRKLGFALAEMSFHEAFELAGDGLQMGRAGSSEQLVSGWFEAETNDEEVYRWAGGHAAVVVRSSRRAGTMRMRYCLPPGRTDGLRLAVRRLHRARELFRAELAYVDPAWRSEDFAVSLPAGDYLVTFDAPSTWSNVDGSDRDFWPENRSLGFALAALEFDGDDGGGERG